MISAFFAISLACRSVRETCCRSFFCRRFLGTLASFGMGCFRIAFLFGWLFGFFGLFFCGFVFIGVFFLSLGFFRLGFALLLAGFRLACAFAAFVRAAHSR